MNNRIGKIIEDYRKAKKLTQSELAKQLGVSNTAISKWENGTNLPDITLIEPLCEILEIDKLLLFTSENKDKEEVSKKCKSVKRKQFTKNSIITILFLLILLFTNYISYNVYKHKLEAIESSKPEIYRFYSTDDEYFVNGYIIFKENESTVIFDQLSYQERKRTPDKEQITSSELFFNINGETVLRNTYLPEKEEMKNKNDVLLNLINTTQHKPIKLDKKNIKNLYIELTLTKDKNTHTKKIKIQVSKEI